MRPQKIGGLIVLLLGLIAMIVKFDRMVLSAAANLGLVMIFFAKEPFDDERVQQLKLKALFHAIWAAIGFNFSVTFSYVIRQVWPALGSAPPVFGSGISAWELLSIVLLVALGFFHFWRWQDGRTEKAE